MVNLLLRVREYRTGRFLRQDGMLESEGGALHKLINVRVHPRQNLVQPAGGQVAFHLFIPLVVIPRMEAGRYFRPLLKGEVLHRRFDLLNAHVANVLVPGLKRKAQLRCHSG